MSNEILFSEKQRFNQWWMLLIILAVNAILVYAIVNQITTDKANDISLFGNYNALIITGVIVLADCLFFILRLDTEITKEEIRVRFFPFQLSYKRYAWKDMSAYYIRQYRPVAEYGGWGLRGICKNTALNVSGNMGLQLEFENGKRLLIGTGKPEEMKKALAKTKTDSTKYRNTIEDTL